MDFSMNNFDMFSNMGNNSMSWQNASQTLGNSTGYDPYSSPSMTGYGNSGGGYYDSFGSGSTGYGSYGSSYGSSYSGYYAPQQTAGDKLMGQIFGSNSTTCSSMSEADYWINVGNSLLTSSGGYTGGFGGGTGMGGSMGMGGFGMGGFGMGGGSGIMSSGNMQSMMQRAIQKDQFAIYCRQQGLTEPQVEQAKKYYSSGVPADQALQRARNMGGGNDNDIMSMMLPLVMMMGLGGNSEEGSEDSSGGLGGLGAMLPLLLGMGGSGSSGGMGGLGSLFGMFGGMFGGSEEA